MQKISSFFRFPERKTDFKTEIIAGLTTFMTMAYVLAVQPSALVGFGDAVSLVDINGVLITKEAIMIMVALVSAFFTFIMALYANLPFAISCSMGTNFLFGLLLQQGDYSFGAIMAMSFSSGLLLTLGTIFGIRDIIVRVIPRNIKIAIGTAIGFFVAYLGFKNSGIGTFTSGIGRGDFTDPSVYLALLGLVIIAVLTARKVKGAILYGIIAITVLGLPLGVTPMPTTWFQVPDPSTVSNIVFTMNFGEIFNLEALLLVFICFVSDFFSTMGTMLGVAGKAGMLDDNGDLPEMNKPFMVDAVGSMMAGALGCTNIGTFVESSAGVEAGGRTGFSSIVTGFLFLLTVFIAPLVTIIPDAATAPALIFVGFLMIGGFKDIDFSDFTESFGPFVMIMFTIFTGSIASGIASGILAYVCIKAFTGRHKEVHPVLYFLCIPLILYFILG